MESGGYQDEEELGGERVSSKYIAKVSGGSLIFAPCGKPGPLAFDAAGTTYTASSTSNHKGNYHYQDTQRPRQPQFP